jgi:hypothetical protein
LDRERDLIQYLPSVLKEIKDFKVLAEAENTEIESLWEDLKNILDDQFINEATKNGVERWESILRIKSLDTDTLDDRKFRILTRLNEQLPYTYKGLENQLILLCGEKEYSFNIDYANYIVVVKVALTAKKQFYEVNNLLNRTIPCNMIINLSLLYNTWDMAKLTWNQAHKLTWQQLREEVI